MNFDRFQPPDASDELANCATCGRRLHYSRLSEDGECQDCEELYGPDDSNQPQKDL